MWTICLNTWMYVRAPVVTYTGACGARSMYMYVMYILLTGVSRCQQSALKANSNGLSFFEVAVATRIHRSRYSIWRSHKCRRWSFNLHIRRIPSPRGEIPLISCIIPRWISWMIKRIVDGVLFACWSMMNSDRLMRNSWEVFVWCVVWWNSVWLLHEGVYG